MFASLGHSIQAPACLVLFQAKEVAMKDSCPVYVDLYFDFNGCI